MVDERRIARLLRGVDERVGSLDAAAGDADARREDELWLAGVKYLFVTAIEGCIDVAHHILASERWEAPDSNADAFVALRRHQVLEQRTALEMSKAVGFRNVLVHQYADVDDDRVIDALGELDDLRRFVEQVSRWTNKQRRPTDEQAE